MINNKDITFVIQGEIYKDIISKSINNIHKFFPGAEVIISTWDGSNLDGIDCPNIILNPDPGCLCHPSNNAQKSNINRQIISTSNGLCQVKTKYAFKLRSDFIINGNNFLSFFERFAAHDNDYSIFTHKVITCCYFTRNPITSSFIFHPSDLALFGLTTDLVSYFSAQPLKESEAYIEDCFGPSLRYTPEQYLFLNFITNNNKKHSVSSRHDLTEPNRIDSLKFILSNFILLNYKQLSIIPQKKHLNIATNPSLFFECIGHKKFVEFYNAHYNTSEKAFFDSNDILFTAYTGIARAQHTLLFISRMPRFYFVRLLKGVLSPQNYDRCKKVYHTILSRIHKYQ